MPRSATAAALRPERDACEGRRTTRTSATSSRRINETDETVPIISRALGLRERDDGATGSLEERDEGNRPLFPSGTDGATGAPDIERMPPSRRGDRGSCPYLSTGDKIILRSRV